MKIDLKNYIEKHNLNEHVKLLGIVPRNDISKYYKVASYFVISSDFEGTPISMLEAMFNKLTVIGSNVNGINQVINKSNGFLFNNKNSSELTLIMEKVIKQDELSKSLSEKGFDNYVKNYDYSKMLNSLIKHI